MQDQQERVFGSARDLQYVFFLFVACKLDGTSNYSWRIVFLIPWLWFGAIFLLATVVGLLLVLARFWARASELVLPLGFLALLMSCVPQFVSYFSLVCLLDQLEASGTTTVTYETVLLPNAVSWFMMWLASLVLVVGLRQKELVRERLLSAGRVWTAQEYLAMQMSYPTETAQRRVDLMSDEEISSMVEEMMRGKTKPAMMVRVGETLYRILTGAENEGTQVVPMESGGDVEMGTLLKGKTLQDQYNNPANSTIENPSHCCSKGSDPTLLAAESVASLLPSLPGQPKDELSESNAMAVHPEPNDIADAASACSDDHQCIICCDAPQTCIFLTCGHGGYCRRCANLVFVRPPNSCPTCRQPIEQIVELECASRRVGDVLRVK